MTGIENAEQVTKASKSNLALSFVCLRREKRRDMTTFYAFCRIVDDIADSTADALNVKQARLNVWKKSIERQVADEPSMAAAIRDLIRRYEIPTKHFHEIIAGVEMDLTIRQYATFEDLRLYCHRVASAVGLVSIEIFGYQNNECRQYAVDLGLALQLTNILRDVGEDWANGGRIYLPQEDMARFGCSRDDIAAHRRSDPFLALMDFEAERAVSFYRSAVAHLPQEDRRSMIAAEIMRAVYTRLLDRMRQDRFRIFEKRYALGKMEKLAMVARVMAGNFLNRPLRTFVL